MPEGFLPRRLGVGILAQPLTAVPTGLSGRRLAGPVWGLIALTAAVKLLTALRRRSLTFPYTAALTE